MSEYCERCVHTDAEIARLTRERDEAKDDQEETQNVYDAIIREHREALESCGLSRVSDKGSLKNDEAIDAHKIMAKEISSLRLALTQAQGDAGAMREALTAERKYHNDRLDLSVGLTLQNHRDCIAHIDAALRSSAGKEFAEKMKWLEEVVAAAKGSAKDLKWVAGQLRHAYAQPNQDKGIADGLLSPQIKRLERFNDTIDVLLAKEPTGDPDAKSA